MSETVYTVTQSAPISEWREFLAWAEQQQETLPEVLTCLVQSARDHNAEERRRERAETRETTQ